MSPGFTGPEFSIAWYGARLASQGFVVITISTNTLFDQPDSRADQLLAALRYVTDKSQARSRVDRNRLAVMGHSTGGGGSLIAARKNPALKAAIPLMGWNLNTNFSDVKVPVFVLSHIREDRCHMVRPDQQRHQVQPVPLPIAKR